MSRDLTLIYQDTGGVGIFAYSHRLELVVPRPRGIPPSWAYEEKQRLYRLCEELLGLHDREWTTVGCGKFTVGFRNKTDAMRIKLAFAPT